MGGKLKNDGMPAIPVAAALNAGGVPAVLVPQVVDSVLYPSVDKVVVWYPGNEYTDAGYLTLTCAYEYLSLDGWAGIDDLSGFIAPALNAGGLPTVYYVGPDFDTTLGHLLISDTGNMTIRVDRGWPPTPA